ncbi:MAG TPA: OmpA family protein [Chitinophagaceae bacterium]|nr:OmpA family protein [Chitinophagaceae bacterium]
MKFCFICILLLVSVASFAQAYDPEKVNKKAISMYETAVRQLQDGYLKEAIPILKKSIEYDARFEDALLSLAGVYQELKDYNNSILNYAAAKKIDSAYFEDYNLSYSISLAGAGKFSEALETLNRFSAIPNLDERGKKSAAYRKRCYEFAIEYAKQHANTNYVFSPQNLGDSINSPESEYYPSFTIDDSVFVFTRRTGNLREDFYKSSLLQNNYSKASLIPGSLNEQPSKGAINISQDGEWLIFAGNFPGKGFGNYDLYIAYNTPAGWSEPFNLGPAINTDGWESSPSLSPDRNALYFSSDRASGYGGRDLYVSYRTADGKWSPAVNMGANINTKADELAPFIHADNATLYYTSNGLPGYGGTDIYVTRKDANGKWSIPENLGYPINTIENEGSLFVASDGVTAYYASDRSDSRGELDLYKFTLPKTVQPVKTLYVKGYVMDAATKKNLPCFVELIDNSTQQSINGVQTDETGFYFFTLPVGKDYTFTVNRKGYLFYSDVFELSNKQPDSTYIKDIFLQPITLHATETLRNIQFATNSAELLPISMIELNKLLQLMNDNPSITVEISGHTDNTGTENFNQTLSLNRAKAVADFLVSKNINTKRITYKGYGSSKPVADNNTEEGRAQNRRTEFVITGL